jgi:hypothetical protein
MIPKILNEWLGKRLRVDMKDGPFDGIVGDLRAIDFENNTLYLHVKHLMWLSSQDQPPYMTRNVLERLGKTEASIVRWESVSCVNLITETVKKEG